jgi:hypothetical protein
MSQAIYPRIAVACTGSSVERDLLEYAALLSQGEPPARVMVAAVPADTVVRTVMPEARNVFNGRAASTLSFQLLMERDLDSVFDAARDFSAGLLLVRHPRSLPDGRAFARRLLSESPCSVCVFPEARAPRIQRVLAGFDLNAEGLSLLGSAAALYRCAGAEELIAMHACFRDSIIDDKEIERGFLEERTLELYRFMARAPIGGINCTPVLENNARFDRALLHTAQRLSADLIVIGSEIRRDMLDILWESSVPILMAKGTRESVSRLEIWKKRLFPYPEPRFN